MKTLLLFSRSNTFRPYSVIASLAADQKELGHDVTVLDLSDYSYVSQGLAPRWYARLFGHDVVPSGLEKVLAKLSVPYSQLRRSGTESPLPHEVHSEFEESLTSELVTYCRTDKPDHSGWFVRETHRRMRLASQPLYGDLMDFLTKHDFERVLLPGGRVSSARLSLAACRDFGLPIEYFEIGRALESSYYTGTQQVHDREGTQAEVLSVTGHLSRDKVETIASQWLNTRMSTGLAIHPYNRDWSGTDLAQRFPESERTAVFFSSSVDEFTSFGGSWKTHTWSNQYEAFEAFMRVLLPRDVRCVLRIHPNLQNKSRAYVKAEIQQIKALKNKHRELEVLWHTDPTNSYSLMHQADYIVVGRSTLGLEASCLGKSVWTTTASRYDAVADVKSILRPEDVSEKSLQPWPVNPEGAQRFVAYWVVQDHPLRFGEENWCTWDSLRAPLSMRIGNLLVSNSLLHKFHLVRLELTKALNRRSGRVLSRKSHAIR